MSEPSNQDDGPISSALAKGKDPLAMYCLGMIEMDNPPRNFTKAIRHLEASAERGFATAQATLGLSLIHI